MKIKEYLNYRLREIDDYGFCSDCRVIKNNKYVYCKLNCKYYSYGEDLHYDVIIKVNNNLYRKCIK